MAARIVRLSTRRGRPRTDQAARLRRPVAGFEGPDGDAVGRIVATADHGTVSERG